MKKIVDTLSRWFQRNQRLLPWRRTRDPYSIWISEVMLQQTQVAAVIPYYERFLARFPTVEALAKSEEADVLSLWSGLGYYSRARNLRRGAQTIVDKFGGRFPLDREALLTVPGIGPYTAGAILSIAFDKPEPLVDGNVQRVFSRYFGWEKPIEESASKHFFWERAETLVLLSDSPRDFNQGLMELGATVCTKGTPRCRICPWTESCEARLWGREEILPKRKPKRAKVDLHWVGLLVEKQGKLLLRRNDPGEWWHGLWDFPRLEMKDKETLESRFGEIRRHWGTQPELLGSARHTVTHHRIHVTACRLVAKSSLKEKGEWFTPDEIGDLPLSSLAKKLLRLNRSATVLK